MSTHPINTRNGFGGGFFGDYTDLAVGSDEVFHALWTTDRSPCSCYAAFPRSSTRTCSWFGPRHTLPAMTRGGSHGYRARLSSETSTIRDTGGASGVAAGKPSAVSGTG